MASMCTSSSTSLSTRTWTCNFVQEFFAEHSGELVDRMNSGDYSLCTSVRRPGFYPSRDYSIYRLRSERTFFLRIHRDEVRRYYLDHSLVLSCVYLLEERLSYIVVLEDTITGSFLLPKTFQPSTEHYDLVFGEYEYNSPYIIALKNKITTLWHYAGILLLLEQMSLAYLGRLVALHSLNTMSRAKTRDEVLEKIHDQFVSSSMCVRLFTLDEIRTRRIHFYIDTRRIIDVLTTDEHGHLRLF